MARAYSISEILTTKHELVEWGEPWQEAFTRPAACGLWCIAGNSGNAKTTFLMEMAKELSKTYKVYVDALEEGKGHTMQQTLLKLGIDETFKNLSIGEEQMDELDARLSKRKAPKVVFIDTIQYANIRFKQFKEMVRKHKDKLFIVNSQAKGKVPKGSVAQDIWYDANLKIWVEGYQATSNGRYNPGGVYTIWEQGAKNYGEITR